MTRKTVYRSMLSDLIALDSAYSDEDYYDLGKSYYESNKERINFDYYKIRLGKYTAIDYEGLGRDIAEQFVME